jgi:hypothetical protein
VITFVTWKWRGPDGRRLFESQHVNVLRAMVARYYAGPHNFVCLTDEPAGLCADIDARPMPVTALEHLQAPQGQKRRRLRNVHRFNRAVLRRTKEAAHFPACYRRLWLFSDEAKQLGDRLFLLDIDCVITGDITPLVAHDVDFIGWADPRFGWNKIAGGAWLLRAGSRVDVWRDFDPALSPAMCLGLGLRGSDQAWLSHKLFPPAVAWTQADGLHKTNWLRPGAPLPRAARIVFTSGHSPPWAQDTQAKHPWIGKHWRL